MFSTAHPFSYNLRQYLRREGDHILFRMWNTSDQIWCIRITWTIVSGKYTIYFILITLSMISSLFNTHLNHSFQCTIYFFPCIIDVLSQLKHISVKTLEYKIAMRHGLSIATPRRYKARLLISYNEQEISF